MEEINRNEGIWQSNEEELDTKICHFNLRRRLVALSVNKNSFDDCLPEWNQIVGHEEREDICLCGQPINNVYFFKNTQTGDLIKAGTICVTRINKEVMKTYKNSLKKKGECFVCEKYHKNLESHYKFKSHKKNVETFNTERKKIIFYLCIKLVNNRKCNEPKCFNLINNKEPGWKTKCSMCYELKNKEFDFFVRNREKILSELCSKFLTFSMKIKSGEYRKCIETNCFETISVKEPYWKKRCLNCYRKM